MPIKMSKAIWYHLPWLVQAIYCNQLTIRIICHVTFWLGGTVIAPLLMMVLNLLYSFKYLLFFRKSYFHICNWKLSISRMNELGRYLVKTVLDDHLLTNFVHFWIHCAFFSELYKDDIKQDTKNAKNCLTSVWISLAEVIQKAEQSTQLNCE